MAPNIGYDEIPPIPTYDEAIAGGSSNPLRSDDRWHHDSIYPEGRGIGDFAEGQALLNPHGQPSVSSANSSSNLTSRLSGYRYPTVETDDEDDDEDSSASEVDDTTHVRREMQELEIGDADVQQRQGNLTSLWGKRINFSLPQWRWKFKWRLPRWRIRLGSHFPRLETSHENLASQSPFAHLRIDGARVFLLISRMLAVSLVLGVIYLLFISDLFTNLTRKMAGQMFDPESVRMYVQGNVNAGNIRGNLQHYTSYAHLAGSEGDYALAMDTRNMFENYGLEGVTVEEYYVYLNYPKPGGRTVEIVDQSGNPTWSAKLEEEDLGTESAGRQTLAFHGLSKAGDVRGPLMYVNYGSRQDFKRLYDSGIDTRGAIALVRYDGTQDDPAMKVKAAEMAGFAGCIIYNDPADNEFLKGATAPKGRFMPADGVRRSAVALRSWVLGDVLTPGWESSKDLPRKPPDESKGLVRIPSLPISLRDAQILLQHLKGVGEQVPEDWVGGVPEVDDWFIGNASSPIVHLRNEQDELERKQIWNIYAQVEGIEQASKSIIIGNQRDSWTFGAAGPHSGTAVMMEIARIFGDLVKKGWRPLRTIQFMSWDAGQYNLIGSTEFVEKNVEALKQDCFAYINLDAAIAGQEFRAAGSPMFRKLLLSILNRVSDPNQNTTLRDLWDRRTGEIDSLGAASDYAAFQDISGTSSLDIRFAGDVILMSSSYETFEWMDLQGDPGFVYHTLLGQVLGLLILELSNRPILPFDVSNYANQLHSWIDELIDWSESKGANVMGNAVFKPFILKDAANEVTAAIIKFIKWELNWEQSVLVAGGWEPAGLGHKRGDYNSRMARFETDLLDNEGIVNRTQYKHVIFGPDLWSAYDGVHFPSIRDAVEAGDWDLANRTVERVTSIIKLAAANLVA